MTKIRFNREANTEPKLVEARTDADVIFLMGAIRAAQNASPEVREKILLDVQLHTQTTANELRFLFAGDNNNEDHSAFDMPNAERRRVVIRNNLLDAAE